MGKLHTNEYDTGDTAFLMLCTMLVFLMIPQIGFLYSGLTRRKSALSIIWACIIAGCIGMFQWWFWGYSLSFSKTASNGFIGNLHNFALRNTLNDAQDAKYPEVLYAAFQGVFCALTCAITMGGVAERARLLPTVVFTFLYATLVYSVLACWAFSSTGWALARWGVLDFAGGSPVEIGSGVGGMALSFVVGRRREKLLINFRPHNVSIVTIGTSLLWFGWLAFNAGSAGGANLRAAYAVWNSNLTAVFAAFSWSLLDWRLERKWSMVAVCSGIVSGLVASTPCAGMIPFWASIILGVVSGICCNLSTQIKYLIGVDDSLDTFAEHGIAGIIGLLFNGLFAADWIIGLDGVTEHDGGWLSHNWKQMYKQVAFIGASVGYTAVMTLLIAYLVNYIPGCHWKVSEEAEQAGIDASEVGEFAYDYVELRRDFYSWFPPTTDAIEAQTMANSTAHSLKVSPKASRLATPRAQTPQPESPDPLSNHSHLLPPSQRKAQ